MKTTDRYTKTLLVLLVAGIWGIALRPAFNFVPAVAQPTNIDNMVWDMKAISLTDADYQSKHNKLLVDGWEPFSYVIDRYTINGKTFNGEDGPIFQRIDNLVSSSSQVFYKKRVPISVLQDRIKLGK